MCVDFIKRASAVVLGGNKGLSVSGACARRNSNRVSVRVMNNLQGEGKGDSLELGSV